MHNLFCTAHNIDCVFKQSHGGVDSSLFNSIACVGGALDWITVEYFSLAYIHLPLLLTLLSAIFSSSSLFILLSWKSSVLDAFEQHEQLPTFKRLKHQGQVLSSMWYASAENAFSLQSKWLMWIRVLRPLWGDDRRGYDQFTRNLESLMHWYKTAFPLKTHLHHCCVPAEGYE